MVWSNKEANHSRRDKSIALEVWNDQMQVLSVLITKKMTHLDDFINEIDIQGNSHKANTNSLNVTRSLG